MSRFLRISLWTLGILTLVIGTTLFWVESQLRPTPLGERVKGLLADAKIKGTIASIEGSLDGTFSAEGIDLTLEDGTHLAASSLKGEARLFSIIRGTYALSRLEIKGIDVDLSLRKKAAPAAIAVPPSTSKTVLPPFVLGPYAASGRVKLADGTLLRFNVQGDEFDSAGKADLRAGIAWPGFVTGKQQTDPRGEIILKAEFNRTLGAAGLDIENISRDLAALNLDLSAKDSSPLAAGSAGLNLIFTKGRTDLTAQLDMSPALFGILSQQLTDVRLNGKLKAAFSRPPGAAGLDLENLSRDLASLNLDLVAKDNRPAAAGSVSLNLSANHPAASNALTFKGSLSDSTNHPAVTFNGTRDKGRMDLAAQLDIDPTHFALLSQQLPNVRLTGKLSGTQESANWQVAVDLLGKFSEKVSGHSSEWNIKADAAGSDVSRSLNHLAVTGNGINISMPKPLNWKGGLLPDDSSGASLSVIANDADLVALTPFLAMADIKPTAGKWTGEAAISFVGGQATVASIRTHRFKGLTIERGGKVLVREIDAAVPLKSENGAITVGPFTVSCVAGNIATGEATLKPGANGAWSATANIDLGIVELASQPNWGDLPVDKLKGIRIAARGAVDCAAGKNPVVNSADARIFRDGNNLLALKLRQRFEIGGAKPTGVLVEASASNLPLESLAAVVPGLKVTGNLNRADLVAGFRAEGLFIRTEGAPLAFVGTSVNWKGKLWVKDCDLSAGLDLLVGDKTTVIGFNQAALTSHGRTLAAGNISLGLAANGLGATTLKLEGDLGELANQPFAGPLNIVSGGQYSASAEYAASGEIAVALNVVDVGLRQSDGRVKQAQVRGKYTPTASGLSAEGSFLLKANNTSAGKFTLTQTNAGPKTDWQGVVTIDNVDVDDVLALLPKSTEAPEEIKNLPTPKPDKNPFWLNQTGTIQVAINKASAYGIVAQKVLLRAEADDKALRLTQLSGQLAEGDLTGRGQLAFVPSINNGPYSLSATIGLKQFEIGAIALAVPAIKEFLQGKANVTASLTSICGTPGELLSKLQVDSEMRSEGGRIRAFGDKNSGSSLAANKAGDLGQVIGLGAMIFGGASNNPKVAKIGAAVAAAAKLQKALSDFNYDTVTVKASRLASGTIKLDQADVRNQTLHLSAKGGISIDPKASFTDWPMVVDAQLRGSGEFANFFSALGYGTAPSKADGMTDGPGVKVTGSINNVKTDLSERLQQAIDGVKSSAAPTQPAQSSSTQPTTTPPATKKRNPLNDLLRELGK